MKTFLFFRLVEDGAHVFRGIPYALPPIGNLRWKPAQLVEHLQDCWNDSYKAIQIGPPCVQRKADGTWIGEEDCLYLDLSTPRVTYEGVLPVIVLVGAETLLGESPGAMKFPSPSMTRKEEVLFVRPAFRLGPLGFLAAHPISRANYPPTSGNYALSDLIAALTWVQRNIRNFGGDPNVSKSLK